MSKMMTAERQAYRIYKLFFDELSSNPENEYYRLKALNCAKITIAELIRESREEETEAENYWIDVMGRLDNGTYNP